MRRDKECGSSDLLSDACFSEFSEKKNCGFSVHALEQFLYNIYRKAQNQEMPRTFREFSQDPRSKSKI